MSWLGWPNHPPLAFCSALVYVCVRAQHSLHSLGFCWHLTWLQGDFPLPCLGDSKLSGKVFPTRIDFS